MSARRRRSAHPPMTAVAMQLDTLDAWLQGRANHGAAATNLSMLDGFVTAIVAGPVSMDPPEWICPLLGIEIDAFNHGGTLEFSAISAVAVRHNAIVETLSRAPKTFEPIFARKPNGEIDAAPWCEGFYAAMKLKLPAWAPLRNLAEINHSLLLPILFHCVDDQAQPMLGPPRKGQETELFRRTAYKDIPPVVEEMRQYWMPTRFKTRS
jgi:uncharacterized protein